MDLDRLRSCSYNELKEIAMTHEIFKTVKIKKKAVLLEKILDYFSENPGSISHFDSERKENIAELLNVEENEKPSVIAKKDNKRTRRNKNLDNSPTETFDKTLLESSNDKADRRRTFVVSEGKDAKVLQEMSVSSGSNKKGGRGKRTKSKDAVKDESSDNSEDNLKSTDMAGKRGTTVVSENDALMPVQEVSDSQEGSKKGRRGKRAKSKDSEEKEISTDKPDLTEVSDKQETFVSEESSDSTLASKGRRGKRTKSKDVVKNGGTSTSDENNDVPDSSETGKKGRRGKRAKSKDVTNYNSVENLESNDKADAGNSVMSRAKDVAALQEVPDSGESSNKGRRGNRTKSKDVVKEDTSDNYLSDEANRTFVISESEGIASFDEISHPQLTSPDSRGRSRRGKNVTSKNTVKNEILNTVENKGVTEDKGDRRGTFVVTDTKELATLKQISGSENSSNKGRRGKRAKSKDVVKVETSDNSLSDNKVDKKETLVQSKKNNVNSTLEVTTSSPALRGKRLRSQGETSDVREDINKSPAPKMMKVSSMKPASRPAAALNKTVSIVTPKRNPYTPKRNITASGASCNKSFTFSPHPAKMLQNSSASKGSVSFMFSDKKNPGQFSAKKMPNFAKVHRELFEKMESLKSYSERKKTRMECFSPLNKTLPDLMSLDKKVAKKASPRNTSGLQVAKSMIPVKSSSNIRLSNRDKISQFANKTHVPDVKAIREKGKDIIKGVRANKRFMLQMKMRKIVD